MAVAAGKALARELPAGEVDAAEAPGQRREPRLRHGRVCGSQENGGRGERGREADGSGQPRDASPVRGPETFSHGARRSGDRDGRGRSSGVEVASWFQLPSTRP